jgi:hypothetical protein
MDQSEVLMFEKDIMKPMKLSTAIRIGAKIRPQCARDFFYENGSCAFGAAYEAATGVMERNVIMEDFFLLWPELENLPDIRIAVSRRNDSGESRESIATWLESQGL